ncbi:MAG TPA: TauD/TfdA family dioxygenase [Bordetella sp.]
MNDRYDMISERSAWRSGLIGGKEGLTMVLTPTHLAALDELMNRTRNQPCESITREQFDHPDLTPFLKQVSDELSKGRGAVILKTLPIDRYSEDELTRMFWGMGVHLGVPAEQNTAGDRIDHVRDMPSDNPLGRRQYSTQELVLHTDSPVGEVLALLCMQTSKSGGRSQLASALAVHNEMAARHPELLDALYVGFPYHRKGKQRAGDPLVTPFPVPVFSKIDGLVSVRYIRDYMEKAALNMGVDMPAVTRAALDKFDEISNREDMSVTFMLERGEIMLVNNLTSLHARTEYEDHDEPEKKRHLVRLWIRVPNGRPYKPEMDLMYNDDPTKPSDAAVMS